MPGPADVPSSNSLAGHATTERPGRVAYSQQVAAREGNFALLISIIVPTLNEETCLGKTLGAIRTLRGRYEVVVADGGSSDATIAAAGDTRVVRAARGRGSQQAAGAEESSGDVLWFLHADSVPSPGALEAIVSALADSRVAGGNFSLRFDGDTRSAQQLTAIYPYLRLMGLCYGDSGIFVRRSVYRDLGGFRPFPLFEDVDLVKRIRRYGTFVTLDEQLTTSSRRFEHRNFAMMFAEWTMLQVLFWAGVSPYRLARLYEPIRRRSQSAT